MGSPSEHRDQLAQFQALFFSYSRAYGSFHITETNAETGKKNGVSRTIRCPTPVSAWDQHLAGGPKGVGLIPLLDDGESVRWGAIDIDDRRIDIFPLEARRRELGLPLVVCRSKSGGAHCYLFLEKPCAAKEVVDALANWAAALGYPGCEIFPKQTHREVDEETGNPRPGNWINLPYYGGDATERYCVHSGERLSLTGFLDAAQSSQVGGDALKIAYFTGMHDTEKPPSAKAREGRNGFLYSTGCRLRQRGGEEEEIRTKLTELNSAANPDDHPNFAHGPLDQRELEQILSSVLSLKPGASSGEIDHLVGELNHRHAVVMVGGKCCVINEHWNPVLGRKEITLSSPPDFQAKHRNRHVRIGERRVSLGKLWLDHPERRQYESITFAPGKETPGLYNLDTGFAVEPKRGDCSRFLEHIRNNVCSCDEDIFDYLNAWMADAVQNRSQRPGTAIVLRGRQGTGKGILCTQFGRLFGQHFAHVSHSGHLTGHFNAHLKDKLVVYADEAFWAGDKKAEGVLKAMITEDTIQIEMKGKDVVAFPNYIRLLISSNHDWVVPAGNEERRFFVLDVGEARMQDRAYFGGILDQMNGGGREALLHYLLDYDLTGIDLGSFPDTQALQDQKTYSATPVQQWWFERLTDGATLSEGRTWLSEIPIDRIYGDYREVATSVGVKRLLSKTGFGKELKRLAPGIKRKRSSKGKNRDWLYELPGLDECRRNFDQLTRSKHDWPKED